MALPPVEYRIRLSQQPPRADPSYFVRQQAAIREAAQRLDNIVAGSTQSTNYSASHRRIVTRIGPGEFGGAYYLLRPLAEGVAKHLQAPFNEYAIDNLALHALTERWPEIVAPYGAYATSQGLLIPDGIELNGIFAQLPDPIAPHVRYLTATPSAQILQSYSPIERTAHDAHAALRSFSLPHGVTQFALWFAPKRYVDSTHGLADVLMLATCDHALPTRCCTQLSLALSALKVSTQLHLARVAARIPELLADLAQGPYTRQRIQLWKAEHRSQLAPLLSTQHDFLKRHGGVRRSRLHHIANISRLQLSRSARQRLAIHEERYQAIRLRRQEPRDIADQLLQNLARAYLRQAT